VDNKVPFDFLLSWQHSCQKVSKSVDACRSYSKPKQCRFFRHSVEFDKCCSRLKIWCLYLACPHRITIQTQHEVRQNTLVIHINIMHILKTYNMYGKYTICMAVMHNFHFHLGLTLISATILFLKNNFSLTETNDFFHYTYSSLEISNFIYNFNYYCIRQADNAEILC